MQSADFRFVIPAAILCVSTFAVGGAALGGDRTPPEKVRLIAHRGGVVDEGRPENSLPAIEAAIERGYWMLEVDVQASRDGRLVVHHDANFQRFYGDSRTLADMTWDQISALRTATALTRPLLFEELCEACAGRIELMVDTKGEDHDQAFFDSMQRSLEDHGLLAGALFIGTRQAKEHFAPHARIGVNRAALEKAIAAGEDVAAGLFLFEHGRTLTADTVALAGKHQVPTVVSINTFHYLGQDALTAGARDIHRMKELGVEYFQIDSPYDRYLRGVDK